VGSLKFIDAAHRISDEESPDLFSLWRWLIQHVPVVYCAHIWNNYIQQQG
jgi:hypothetical protein